ncbi:hypothetical protein JW859_10550 [bacterium]|nr:hypothetical protein [bacterium]
MHRISNILLALVAVGLLLSIFGCTSLALSGDKKYKTDLTNVLLKIKAEIESDGDVPETSISKLEKLLSKSEAEFGKKGSFREAQLIVADLKKANEEPGNKFNLNQNALLKIIGVLETLKTEVQD